MYKSVNNLISETISNRFSLSGEIHPYTTRFSTSNNLHVPKPKTNYMKRGLSYKGVDYWNELPTAIKTCENLDRSVQVPEMGRCVPYIDFWTAKNPRAG